MDGTSLAILTFSIILISIWFLKRKSVKNPLPGPNGLPIVGYLPFLTRNPHLKLTELSKEYGPVFKVKMGSRDVVILCDFKFIREAFADDVFMGRPPDLPFELSETTLKTKAFLGIPWKEQRRFSLHMLRDLGFGKTRMEEHIREEIQELLDRLASAVNKPINLTDFLTPSMSNNISSFIFGQRLKFDDPKRKEMDFHQREVGRLAGALGWQIFFPWINWFSRKFQIGARGQLSRSLGKAKAYCMEQIKEHQATLDPNNIRDYMDGYLLEIEKRKNDPKNTFHTEVLTDVSRAFFGAGSETVRVTVDWVLLVCAAHHLVQERLQSEIDDVLGRDGFPDGTHRARMPFTEAVILETMRWRTIVPLNVMRSNLEDTELNGYHIPKNSNILAILWTLDHDKALWGNDVDEFKPERFLTDDGKKVTKPEHFIPFSIGKRSCPGKSLAEIEVFLYVVAILQKFKICLPPGKEADFEGILGISLQPKSQEIKLELRHN